MKNVNNYEYAPVPFELVVWVKANEAEIKKAHREGRARTFILAEKARLDIKYSQCVAFTSWYLDLGLL